MAVGHSTATSSKTCSSCGISKDRSLFYKATCCKDGLRGECKSCVAKKQKKYNKENAETISEKKKENYKKQDANERKQKRAEYYLENKDRIKRKSRRYHLKNRDSILKRRRLDWHKNKQKHRIKATEYREQNRDSIRAANRSFYHANKERLKPSRKRASAFRRKAEGALSKSIVSELYKKQKGKCACCGRLLNDDYHLDHIQPLSKGGKNVDSNIQLLTSTCNLRKSAKDPIEYMQDKGYLL